MTHPGLRGARKGPNSPRTATPRLLCLLGSLCAAPAAWAQPVDTCPRVAPDDFEACGGGPCVVDFPESASGESGLPVLQQFKEAVQRENVTVRIGPDVELDFTDLREEVGLPIRPARCVTIRSVAGFLADPQEPEDPEEPEEPEGPPRPPILTEGPDRVEHRPPPPAPDENGGVAAPLDEEDLEEAGEAIAPELTPSVEDRLGRSRTSLGPVVRYGGDADDPERVQFFKLTCLDEDRQERWGDGVRMAGFRLFGPDFGQAEVGHQGINICGCRDVGISHMEIAGWGGAGVYITDDEPEGDFCRAGRIDEPEQVRITHNHFHHHQLPRGVFDSHAGGYGIDVQDGAWALIARNVFDWNRHAIAASGDAGGYDAVGNLVLRGGGLHADVGPFQFRTHQFDVHGDDSCPWWWPSDSRLNCGNAGHRFLFAGNAFQYRNGNAIKIRGKPRVRAVIRENAFPHEGLEDDWGDDAIHLRTKENVTLGPGNRIEIDSYGKYGVCAFDGDGVDDLFLATGVSWWVSPQGRFRWTPLGDKAGLRSDLRFAYVDGDLRCDVLADNDGQIMVVSGGVGPWRSLGSFGVPLSELAFGRFGPPPEGVDPDEVPPTTHLFRRASDGQWSITRLDEIAWEEVERSKKPMNQLRFGDFTGDGITDVLGVIDEGWAISEGARTPWRPLNPLSDGTGSLFVANLDDDDEIDDVLKLSRATSIAPRATTFRWLRSRNGTGPWTPFAQHELPGRVRAHGFVGRFRPDGHGATLLIPPDRVGRFRSEAASPAEWVSTFSY